MKLNELTVIKAPNPTGTGRKVFLAGSIEMGKAEDWQALVAREFGDLDVTLLNPRRDSWDASWEQSITNPKFKEQVTWELNGLDEADLIVMYLDPATKSPISLLELGLHASSGKLIVCCPGGFWRKGNVEVVCERYGIPLVDSLDLLLRRVRERLT